MVNIRILLYRWNSGIFRARMVRPLIVSITFLILLAIIFSVDGFAKHVTTQYPLSISSGPCPSWWSVVESPNLNSEYNFLSDIEAISTNDVWATGSADGTNTELFQHWNGSDWRLVAGAQIVSDTFYLNGLTSTSANDVWAVGYHYPGTGEPHTLIEHWNGNDWQFIPGQDPPSHGNILNAVDALSPNDIWAVGRSTTSSTQINSLIQHWDGTKWIIAPSPNYTATGSINALYGVDAIAVNDVWAVGHYRAGSGMPRRTLIQHWDGAQWQIVPGANINNSPHILRSVSAISANDVWAVGNYVYQGNYRTLIEHWDGTQWSIIPSPNAITNNSNLLRSVSAVSPSNIWAAGYYFDGYNNKTLLLHWDGSTWNIVKSPNPGQSNITYAVDTFPDGEAWAAGSTNSGASDQTLILHYAPSCATVTPTPIQPTPTPTACTQGFNVVSSPNGLYPAEFTNITAISASEAWGVGAYHLGNGAGNYSLLEHWDGSQWTIVPNESREPGNNSLKDIDAGSSDDVWTVGDYYSNTTQTLTKHWDGSQWANVSSPNPGLAVSSLQGVSVLSTGEAWAVGFVSDYANQANPQTLILHWEGQQWTIVPSPNPGVDGNKLASVEAISPTNAWAVGYQYDGDAQEALILHWNGTMWSTTLLPASEPYMESSSLADISASAENDIWAVGGYGDNRYNGSAPLIMHWNGSEWRIVEEPIAGALGVLTSVYATSAQDVWVIGPNFRGDFVLHWDGTFWGTFPAGWPRQSGMSFTGITATSAHDVWLSNNLSSPITKSAIQHYDGTCFCSSQFTDIVPGSTFYLFLRCLSCREILGGYPCGSAGEPCDPEQNPYFRPNNPVTRGQLAKIVSLAIGNDYGFGPEAQTFEDVPPNSTFWFWIEQISRRYIVDGYSCGGPSEPCVAPDNRPYFRPGNSATRGQIAKIITKAVFYHDPIPSDRQTFEDVLPGSTFWFYIEELANHGIIEGYPCNGVGEPCVPPANRRYFRPAADVTRAQISKITANTFFPNCITLEP